ncbi:MAG: MarR family transcriptional regulator [Flavobacteriales bacterium]|nr:MarR family transcriptional regulator [Flavobacteriales bacterium]
MKKIDKGSQQISPSMCPLIRLSIISRKLSKLFKKNFSKLNLTQSQVSILLMLSEMGNIAQSAIGKYLELERSTVTRDLVRLIDRGYLNKTAGGVSPTIGLTKEGTKMSKLVVREWEKGFNTAFELLGRQGMNAVGELEKKMRV